MDERKLAQIFHREWEDSQQGDGAQSSEAPEPVRQVYQVARRLANADYSHESRVRQTLKQRLTTLEIADGRAKSGFALGWLSSSVRIAAWVAAALVLILSLIWALNTLIPRPVPGVLGTLSIEAVSDDSANLGKLAYFRSGDIWVKRLPDGQAQQLTTEGLNTQPRWSPSGEWLAYHHGEDQLWMMHAEGSGRVQLPGSVSLDAFAWSPVADRLAYVDGMKELLLIEPGGEPQILVSSGERQTIPYLAWSSDGAWIAYQWQVPPLNPPPAYLSLWKVSADGGEPLELFSDTGEQLQTGVYRLAGWTSDGRNLIFWGGNPFFSASLGADGLPIFLLSAQDGEPQQLVESALLYQDYVRPDPAGKGEIAVIVGGFRESWNNKRLYRFDGTEAIPLSSADFVAASPAWSPDGGRIAYVQMPDAGNLAGGEPARQALMQRRLWVVDVSSGKAQQLTDDPTYRDEYPLWSEDGSTILFVRMDEASRLSLWMAPVAGGDPYIVVEGLLTDDLSLPESGWFGYFGHLDWSGLFDWWRGPASRPTPPAPTEAGEFISKDQAVEIAIRVATEQHLRAIEGPENIQTDFIERRELWRVTMDGLWTLKGGPLPAEGEPTPEPLIFRHLTVEINARTGDLISVSNVGASPLSGTPEPLEEIQVAEGDPSILPPFPTRDPDELYPGLIEVRDLLDRFYGPLRSSPGWVHMVVRREVPEGSGLYGPLTEWTNEDWMQIDASGFIVAFVHIERAGDGRVLQQTIAKDGETHNLTFSLTGTYTPYRFDPGADLYDSLLTQLRSGQPLNRSETTLDGRAAWTFSFGETYAEPTEVGGVLTAGIQKRNVLNPGTGALLLTEMMRLTPDGLEQPVWRETNQVIERVEAPPEEVLELLGQETGPYTPRPAEGTPAPPGFDPSESQLTKRTIEGDDFNRPTLFFGDIYAGGYLLGRVDFGSVPDGLCDRSADGSKLAFIPNDE